MRAWLYDTLVGDEVLQGHLGGPAETLDRVMPRQSQDNVLAARPFLIYGLGNSTDEQLGDSTADDVEAERQFFQVWVHDAGGDYNLIDEIVEDVKRALIGKSHPPSKVLTIRYLETSQEFSNETYDTNFRYIRFQAIKARGRIPA